MILDALLMFDGASNPLAGVAITVTRDSTNELDMKNQRDMGIGDNVLDILVLITETFTAGGAATLVVSIQGARDNGGAPGTYYPMVNSPTYAVAQLTAGRELLRAPLPMWDPASAGAVAADAAAVPRFYKLVYTVATGPMTAGKVISTLVDHSGRQANRSYPSGIPVQTYA